MNLLRCTKRPSLSNTKLSKEVLDYIVKNTKAKSDDVVEYYNGFLKDFPNGYIKKTDFKKFINSYNQINDDRMDDFINYCFSIYDTNNDGIIDFKEFYIKIWIESFGTLQQKTELAFKFFDINKDNYIDKSDIKKIFKSLSKASKPFGKNRGSEYKERMEDIDSNSNKIMELADTNKDNKISYEEFQNAVVTYEFVRRLMIYTLF